MGKGKHEAADREAEIARLRGMVLHEQKRTVAIEALGSRARATLEAALAALADQLRALRRQNNDLQAANNALLARARAAEALGRTHTPARLEAAGIASMQVAAGFVQGNAPPDGLTRHQAIGLAALNAETPYA